MELTNWMLSHMPGSNLGPRNRHSIDCRTISRHMRATSREQHSPFCRPSLFMLNLLCEPCRCGAIRGTDLDHAPQYYSSGQWSQSSALVSYTTMSNDSAAVSVGGFDGSSGSSTSVSSPIVSRGASRESTRQPDGTLGIVSVARRPFGGRRRITHGTTKEKECWTGWCLVGNYGTMDGHLVENCEVENCEGKKLEVELGLTEDTM